MRMMRAVLAVSLGLCGWSAGVLAAEIPFKVAEAAYDNVVKEEVYNATVEAVNQSTVSAQTSGRVTEINFDVDDYVAKGSVLLRIRDTQQRAAVKAAEARYKEAQSEYRRVRELLRKNLVSKSVFDKAEAALKSAKAGLDQAQEQLANTVVRAPYSGIVVARHIEVGETANPGQPLMTGLSLEQLRATASVPQADIVAVRKLKQARIILPAVDQTVQGESLTISPFADPQSHTFQVRVNMPPGQHGVYPGMFAKVAFAVGQQRSLLIPVKAVARRSEVTAVYVVKDGKVSFRQIRVGDRHDDSIEVLAGLDAGEQVALDPIRAGVWLKEKRNGGANE